MFALIIVFVLTNGNLTTSKVVLYPTEGACESSLALNEMYQRGVHSADGVKLVGFCIPAEVDAPRTST
jgi:hypothetical protein